MKVTYKLIIAMSFLIGLNSCYKESDLDYHDMDVTLTLYDKSFSERTDTNFQTYKTFVIRDSVGLISDYIDEGSDTWRKFYKKDGTSDYIRQSIRKKFLEKGYVQVDSIKNADFAVNLVATVMQTDVYVGYPGYWYGWPGYYPYWGWGYYKNADASKSSNNLNYYYYYDYWYGYYPWYGGGYSYSYETATVMVEMIDAESLNKYYKFIDGKTKDELENIPKDDFPVIHYRWQSFLNGVLTYDASYGKDRLDRSIDESFKQSPYIKSANN